MTYEQGYRDSCYRESSIRWRADLRGRVHRGRADVRRLPPRRGQGHVERQRAGGSAVSWSLSESIIIKLDDRRCGRRAARGRHCSTWSSCSSSTRPRGSAPPSSPTPRDSTSSSAPSRAPGKNGIVPVFLKDFGFPDICKGYLYEAMSIPHTDLNGFR